MAKQSIYEYICEHVQDGVLPENFQLPQDEKEDMNFAPGTRDGIYDFHIPRGEVSEEDEKSIKEMIETASKGKYKEAEKIAKELGKKTHALPLMAAVQQYIADHIDNLNDEKLFQFACTMLECSDDKECVKFGFGISDLFECRDEGFRNTIRTLGLSDEFTLYSAISMLMWTGGIFEIFDLVKKVHGWGRIHAVDRLAPETDEIRDWLFFEGIKNNVLPGYSAFVVFMNSHAEERLEKKMSRKEFDAVSDLIENLLPDEPVPGFSNLANSGEILKKYLTRAGEQELNEKDLTVIREVKLFADNKEHPMPEVSDMCKALLGR